MSHTDLILWLVCTYASTRGLISVYQGSILGSVDTGLSYSFITLGHIQSALIHVLLGWAMIKKSIIALVGYLYFEITSHMLFIEWRWFMVDNPIFWQASLINWPK